MRHPRCTCRTQQERRRRKSRTSRGVAMTRHTPYVALALFSVVAGVKAGSTGQGGHPSHGSEAPQPAIRMRFESEQPRRAEVAPPAPGAELPILVRPGTLAAQIGELAGHAVRVAYARVVGVINPRVFLIDTAMRLPPIVGHRSRVLVFVESGGLRVTPEQIVASTVTIHGLARTLLAMQVGSEAVWPTALTRDKVEKLEIRAAVLARSVRTAEGFELTHASAAPP